MIPKIFVKRFYELSLNRDFAEAERILTQVKEKLSNSPWNNGYIQALEGMLTANRAKDDQDLYFNRLQSGKTDIANTIEQIKSRSQNWMSAEFDRGFFTAWADFIDYAKKIKIVNSSSVNTQNQKREEQSSSDDPELSSESVE